MTLDAPDQRAIEPFADRSRPEHSTLEAWAAEHGLSVRDDSDSAVIRALVLAGAEVLRAKALEDGYTRLAASREDDLDERRAVRDRALNRTARPAR